MTLLLGCGSAFAGGADGSVQGDVSMQDTAQYVTNLRDVEVVGIKQTPGGNMGLTTLVDSVDVARYRIETVRDLSDIVPNFYVPAYGSRMTSSIYVRGLGSRIDQPVVGLNVDGVPYLNKDNYDFDLLDIKSIEVQRGSRAVLNGRNAMGGQINIRTLSPWDFKGFRAYADFGRANTATAAVSWYGRLSSKVATAVIANIGITDGFYKNAAKREGNDYCGRESQESLRWKLSWHPDSRWSLANTFAIGGSKQNGYPYENVATGMIAYNDTTFYRRFSFSDGLKISYTGKRMIATSETSVQYLNDNMTLDQDFLPADYFTLTQRRKEWAITQDLYAKGMHSRYDWLLGVFGFYKPTDMSAPVTFLNTGIERLIENNVNQHLPAGMQLRWDERSMVLGSHFDIHDGGFAVYHQSTLRLGHFTLQGGLRWDIEHVSLDYRSQCNASATMFRQMPTGNMVPIGSRPIDLDKSGNLSQTFNQLLPQVSVAYATGPVTLTASVAKGYKAGGYNTQMFSDVLQQQLMESMGMQATYDIDAMLTYKPEKSWTYELTAAIDNHSASHPFKAEATLFMMPCWDQQLTIFPPGQTTGRAMINAGRTRSAGVELSASYSPVEPLALRASYGYTNATFRQHNSLLDIDLRGKRLPYAPMHTVFASVDWKLPFTFWNIQPSVNVSTRAVGDIYWDDMNTAKQPFYATLDASVTLTHRLVSLTLWGSNLTNTKYSTFHFQSMGNTFVQRANPWSVGGTFRIYFRQD